MNLFIKYLKPFALTMTGGLVIKIIGTLMDLALPYLLALIIDDVVPRENLNEILFWGGVMIVCSVVAVVGNIIANRIASRVARDTTEKLRHDLFTKVMYLSSKQIDEVGIPSLESRLTSDTFQVHHVVGMIQRIGVRAPILLIGGILITLSLDSVLTLVMVATLPFITLSILYISKKGIPMFTNVQKKVDAMTRVVRENSGGVRVIKALSKTAFERNRFDNSNKDLIKTEKKANLTMALTNPLMTLFLNCGLAAVILVGALRVRDGVSEAGAIIAFMSYFTIITNAMMVITRIFTMMSRGIASANRIEEVLNMGEELLPIPKNEAEKPTALEDGYVVFRNVNFSYNNIKNNLENISFNLKKGQTLGIIGATGSGKTTVISLIMRYYDVNSGNIFIDGKDIRSYSLKELHSKIGIVRQNDFIYNDTLGENISFARDLDMDKIKAAAVSAQAYEFIENLEDGFEHNLTSNGTNISGGQKQRVLISRALAQKPELLILDDSSSALDYKTDSNLRRELDKNYKDITRVIVAQRVSAIMNADIIMVLNEGKIEALGSHSELLESCELYKEISDSQLGGAIVD
ncbi:MAG: ABC transporter ATP-binding protein [Oscillospiraceae bacterium]|nr:ABC transporter ATP-binding protein [Oscillospiraceae bacterium]